MLAPQEQVETALGADNPDRWMIRCHVLEHQASGIAGIPRIREAA